jgi:hypothetical protein
MLDSATLVIELMKGELVFDGAGDRFGSSRW